MLSTMALATYMQATVLFSGLWLGPDYAMQIDPSGIATIMWMDKQSAYVFFRQPERTTDGTLVLRGTALSTTDNNKVSSGDTVLIIMDAHIMGVVRPDYTVRWYNTVCWHGYNQPRGTYTYPC